MKRSVISIIIATFNAEATLERCLRSIMEQKSNQIELLVIDGGSNDSTARIVKSFGSGVDYFISEPDKGIYDAWNKGVAAAKGQWLMFLGADDCLMPDSLNTYLHFLEKHDPDEVDIICGQCEYYTRNGEFIKVMGIPYEFNEFKHHMLISHGSTLHNRKLFEELGQFDITYRCCADYDFLLRRPLNAMHIPQPLIAMQTGGASYSFGALYEAYSIKRKHGYSVLWSDIYYLLGGIANLTWERTLAFLQNRR